MRKEAARLGRRDVNKTVGMDEGKGWAALGRRQESYRLCVRAK